MSTPIVNTGQPTLYSMTAAHCSPSNVPTPTPATSMDMPSVRSANFYSTTALAVVFLFDTSGSG